MKKRAEKIDRYLDGRMNAEERAAFAREVAEDTDVRSEFAAEQILRNQESVPFVPGANESALPPVLHAALSSTGRPPEQTGAGPKPTGSFPAFPGWTLTLGLLLGTLAGIFIGIVVVDDRDSQPPIDSGSAAPAWNAAALPDQPDPAQVSGGRESITDPSVPARTEEVVEGSVVKKGALTGSANSTTSTSHEELAEEVNDERTDLTTEDNSGKEMKQLRAAIEKRADQAPIEHHRDSLRLKLDVE